MSEGKRRSFLKLTRLACWPEAKAMLEQGMTPWAVGEWIQGTKREYRDVKPVSLVRQLARYKEAAASGNEPMTPQSFIDKEVGSKTGKIDQLDEIKKLILVQKGRIEKDLKLEQNMPKLLKDLRVEIVTLYDLLEKELRLEMELGLRQHAPLEVHHKHAHLGVVASGSLGEVLKMLPSEERSQLRLAIQTAYRNRGGVDEDSRISGGREELEDGDGGTEVPSADKRDADPDAPSADVLVG